MQWIHFWHSAWHKSTFSFCFKPLSIWCKIKITSELHANLPMRKLAFSNWQFDSFPYKISLPKMLKIKCFHWLSFVQIDPEDWSDNESSFNPKYKKLQLSSSKLNCFQIPELLNPFVNPVFCGKNAMVVTENGEMRSINDVLWFALDKSKEMYCWGGTNSILIVMTECVAWS